MWAKMFHTKAVLIPLFAGIDIGFGIEECNKMTLIPNPDSDPGL